MKLHPPHNNRAIRGLLAVAAVATMAFATLAPVPAQAAEYVARVEYDNGTVIGNYTNRDEAVQAAFGEGKKLIMLSDWVSSSAIKLKCKEPLTIDMNGHSIIGKMSDSVIVASGKGGLTLTSSKPKTQFTYLLYTKDEEDPGTKTGLISGGLITAGYDKYGAGMYVCSGSKVTLDGVSVAGNRTVYDGFGGGVYVANDATLTLQGHATIEGNSVRADNYGGGVYLYTGATVNIDDGASIRNNNASRGAGIASTEDNVHINITDGGSIENNLAWNCGGGIYLSGYNFEVTGDGKGFISDNLAKWQDGGGILVAEHDRVGLDDKGLIENVNFKRNTAKRDGGAIELELENNTVKNCTFTGNSAKEQGGAIYVNDDNNTIDGCEITGNWCGTEGGGVYVPYRYDVKMVGVCTVKNNTRGKDSGNNDDVYLNTIHGQTGFAYITGGVSKGSSVGVRTPNAGDRRIGDKINNETKDCFFIDLDGYYVSYGSDHGGDMWQRHRTKEFELTVKGRSVGHYKQGTAVTVNGTSSTSAKVFKCWNADRSTGLYPFLDYISDSDLKNPTVSFKMPQNDVRLEAIFVTRASELTLDVDAPTAGKPLPATGKLSWKDGNGKAHEKEVALTWLEKGGDEWVPASGEAGYGATYAAEVSVDQDLDNELAFALDIDAAKQTVRIGGADVGAASASVDASGRLRMRTKGCATEKPTVTSVEGASVTVQEGATEADFRKLLPETAVARTNAGTAVKLEVDASKGDLSALIEGGAVKKPADAKTVTVSIPLKASDAVTVPSGKSSVAVTVTVTDAPKTAPEAPTVSPDEGTYSTSGDKDKFDNGILKVTATCATENAAIKYRLDHCDDGWVDDAAAHDYGDGIALAKKENDQRLYELEIWSVKDGLESEHGFYLYVIDDIQTVTVTVEGTDTGLSPQEKKLEEHSVRKGKSLTVTAPDRTGYAFEKWTVGGEDRTGSALALDSVDENATVTAVYNPVVTAVDIDIDAPEAHKTLSQAATSVKVKAGGSEGWTDVTALLTNGRDNPKVTWAPGGREAEDEETGELVDTGEAEHMAAYTATVALAKGGSASTARYVVADGASVYCKGTEIDEASACIATAADGTKTACLAFPSTGPVEETELSSLKDVELTYKEACSYQVKQDAGSSASWSLPREVVVTGSCGCKVPLTIAWNKVEGFNRSNYDGQALTAKGTVEYPSYVDHKGASETVEVKINVLKAEAVGALQASIPSGTYKGTQDVAFVCETDGVTIRYTTDGSEPTESSKIYGADSDESGEALDGDWIEVAQSTNLKVKAFRDGWKPSETLGVSYRIVHDVTFDSAGGSAVETQEVEHGKAASKPADPKLEGLAFEGWTDADGRAYDFSEAVTGDIALHANWSAKGGTVEVHTVTFDTAGGTEVTEQHIAHGGRANEPEEPTLKGFKFEGWRTEDGSKYDFRTKVTSDVALHAAWSRGGETVAAYTVTFDCAGGSAVEAQTVADGARAKEPGTPTLTGFDFEGWCTGDGEGYDFGSKVTGDLVLYARWSANGEAALAHLVTFDANGGNRVPAQTVTDGDKATEPEKPTRKGYDFTGWTLDGKAFDFSTPVTDDLELKATWKAKDSKKDDKSDTDENKDGDKGDADSGDNKKGDESKTTAVTTVTKAADSNLAATGDRTPIIVGLLVVLGILAAAAGILSKRKKQ